MLKTVPLLPETRWHQKPLVRERQVAGPALNALKDEINSALAARKASLADAALEERLRSEWLDVTLPARRRG